MRVRFTRLYISAAGMSCRIQKAFGLLGETFSQRYFCSTWSAGSGGHLHNHFRILLLLVCRKTIEIQSLILKHLYLIPSEPLLHISSLLYSALDPETAKPQTRMIQFFFFYRGVSVGMHQMFQIFVELNWSRVCILIYVDSQFDWFDCYIIIVTY